MTGNEIRIVAVNAGRDDGDDDDDEVESDLPGGGVAGRLISVVFVDGLLLVESERFRTPMASEASSVDIV